MFAYDPLGRVTSVSEKAQGKKTLHCERFVYGDKASKEANGVGRLLKHYDSAGLREISNYSVLGNVLSENRQFLASTTEIDWPEALTERQSLLETEYYTTRWKYNGLGETISQSDAKGNRHYSVYGIAGELLSSSLQLKAGTEQTVISKQTYSAAGQLLEKRLSNGVVIHYGYEEKTQRLSRLQSVRLSDNKSLQDLNYRYDPVGNILEIINKAREPGFYANEKTETVSQYCYDSLYQLIEASGLESQQAAKESATRNPALRLGNPDASRCVNYTRNYRYDAGGNLYAIQHRGAQSYTQRLTIDSNSNRGIEKRDSGPSLAESFDGNGNLLYLNTEQPLQWNSRNQLQQVTQIKREAYSDAEVYRYEASGQRVEKLTQKLAENQLHYERVRYLPAIELREHWQTDIRGQNKKITEQLWVIQIDGVRTLHWATGRPDDMENDSLRYTLTDQLGSNQLELNAKGNIINYESYYPYGGTAIWATKNAIEAYYQFIRYSGKERDATGLYYYGYRYYLPWLGRWLNPDPSGISDGLNLFQMVYNNPIIFVDDNGYIPKKYKFSELYPRMEYDPVMGKAYQPIDKIYSFGKKVNVKAFPFKSEEGAKLFYLFTGSRRADTLAFFAHGGYEPYKHEEYIPKSLKEIDLATVPIIDLAGPHGSSLLHKVQHSLTKKPYASISEEGITFTSQQAVIDYNRFGYEKITGSFNKGMFANYVLGKKETQPSKEQLQRGIRNRLEEVAEIVEFSRDLGSAVDILTIRTDPLTLDFALELANYYNYKRVLLSFCKADVFTPRSNRPKFYRSSLEEITRSPPLFVPWEQTSKFSKAPQSQSRYAETSF